MSGLFYFERRKNMANYTAASRTNYFRVTDEDKYSELFSNLTSEDIINDFT